MTNQTVKSPKTLKEQKAQRNRLLAAGVLLVAVAVFVISGFAGKVFNSLFPAPTPESDPIAQAVNAGVTAYLNFDLTGDYEAWVENLCSLSTLMSCDATKNYFGPQMREMATESQMSSVTSEVRAIMKVDDMTNPVTNSPSQVWAVEYTVTNWNGETNSIDYVLVSQVEGQWKYDSFVMLPQKQLDTLYGAKLTPTVQP